jgi:hypothetical protein
VYQSARDNAANNSGWQAMGVWNVPGGTPPGNGTSVIGLNQGRFEGSSTMNLGALLADAQGIEDLSVVNILISSTLDAHNACYSGFVRASNILVLVNDAGAAGGPSWARQRSSPIRRRR